MSDVEELVREAAQDAPPSASLAQHENVSRLLWAMLYASGTMRWGHGWPDAVIAEFVRAGLAPPTRSTLRWHRGRMVEEPEVYAEHCPDPALVEDLRRRRA